MTKEEHRKKGKSFWETVPGILTGLTAFLTAVGGLVTLVLSLPRPNAFFPATPTPAVTATPTTGQPVVIGSSSFSNKLHSGTVYYYDFDKPEQTTNATSGSDFDFKPDNPDDPNTQILVAPYNGAKFASRSPGRFPWEVEAGGMTTAQSVYSVPQRNDIPCTTSEGKYCTFSLDLRNNGDFVVSFKLYELR